MVIPFLPLFLVQLGVRTHQDVWSGLMFSISFLMGALISPFWGSLADKYGRKPMILRSGFSLCIAYLLISVVQNPYELLAMRALQGLLAGYIPGAIALIGTNTPENRVGYALATFSTATATGSIIGPLLGGTISHLFSSRTAFVIAGLIMLVATFLVLAYVKEDKFVPTKNRSSVFGAFKLAKNNTAFLSVLMITALTAFSIMTIEPVITLYIASLGEKQDASLVAGIVFSLVGIASLLFAGRWGKLADRVGFRTTLLIGLLGGGLGNILQIPFHNVWGFSIVRFLYGAFFCAVFPALNGLVVRTNAEEFRGRAFGLNQSANQIGTMFGPIVGGVLAEKFSIHSVFGVTGALLLITAGLSFWAKQKVGSTAAASGVTSAR